MADVQLASGIFQRIPDQITAIGDVYDKTSNAIVTSYQDLQFTTEEIKEKFSLLSKYASGDKLKLLKSFDIKNGITIDKDGVIGRIGSALSDSAAKAKTFLKEMAEKKDAAMAFYQENKNKVTGLISEANKVYSAVGDVYTAVASANLTDMRSITRVINSLGRASSLSLSADGPIGGIYASLVNEAGELGIPGAYNDVVAVIYETNDIYNKGAAIYQLSTSVLPNAIARGDIRMIGNIADQIGNGSISMMRPDTVRGISKNNMGYPDDRRLQSVYEDYKGIYRSVEPDWDSSVWQPLESSAQAIPVRDVSPVLVGSDHTRNVFVTGSIRSNDPEDKIFAIMDKVGIRSVDDEIGKRFPYSTSRGQPETMGFSRNPSGY